MPGKFLDEIDDDDETLEDDGLPTAPRSMKLRTTRSASAIITTTKSDDTHSGVAPAMGCSVCCATSTLSTLKPCGHLICSSCLTGALNIVGEKDMRCATCELPVEDFKLLSSVKLDSTGEEMRKSSPISTDDKQDPVKLLPSAFNELNIKDRDPQQIENPAQQAHSPGSPQSTSLTDTAVLRIDNVPWVS